MVESDIDSALMTNGNAALVATQILSVWAGQHGPLASAASTRLNRLARNRPSDVEMALRIFERIYPGTRRVTSYGPDILPPPESLLSEDLAHTLTPYVSRGSIGDAVIDILRSLSSGRLEELNDRLLDEQVQNSLIDLKNNLPVSQWYQGARMCDMLANWYERQPAIISKLPDNEVSSDL
jgi:hypothetical protein